MTTKNKIQKRIMSFEDFKLQVEISMEDIYKDIYARNRERIKVKKEDVAVRNLETIFNATLSLANTKGFQAMSLRDLAGETGLSMGALYSYFRGKDELIDIIQTQAREVIIRVFGEYIDESYNPLEKLNIAVRAHLYLSEVMRDWFYFSYMESKNLKKEEQKKAIQGELFTEQVFVNIIQEGVSKDLFQTESPGLVASSIKALLQDWYLKRWKYTRRKISIDAYALFITDLVEKYICKK